MGPPTSMRCVTVRLENGDKVLVSSDSTRIFLQLRHGTPTNRACRSRHPYRYFVDPGNLLNAEQPTYVILDTLKPDVTSYQKTSKDTVFPSSTKSRYPVFRN